MRDIRVAVVGGGPAGIYAADILTKAYPNASVDVIERLPAPYGLVRYGVAPDHPRIKEIIKALHRVLSQPQIRFLGNVDYGTDLKMSDLRRFYDAVIFSTGAMADRPLDIPGVDLPGSYGAADFVSWYDGHPDVPREWPLEAKEVAVVGAGNVALDVARMLVKTADEQLTTEIPANVYDGLKANACTDVHVFARRGPAQIKFSPMELRELSHSPNVDVIVHPEGFEIDEAGQEAINSSKQTKMVVNTLLKYVETEPTGAPHRIHIHMCQSPVEILGDGKVEAFRTERTELVDGSARGTGETTDWPVQAVYRAVGYLSSPLVDLPFDHQAGVIPNEAGRVIDMDGNHQPGTYVTGWIKRGPVGLIGHTKSDASQTIDCLLEDVDSLQPAEVSDPDAIVQHLVERGVEVTSWEDWGRLDAHEMALGEEQGRLRVKVVPREEMVSRSRG
ncbi:pyridine nucleotide-disulfide oxidoreductase [Luteipulveratus halotolerans]|uniref:ferredoxin--NADP(+) reductase n=1 Tax=Luteipulveratus halotolerans TaxID=1631356 RepID=A0A0L6CK45_9MICO|nr:FAD-dependent oxidoreductase [Luteipulveratus halotolerans]KNX37975.1 pyridine nucleotide-disulfide oxidoreductase [Luteipulveratus halotolerans]